MRWNHPTKGVQAPATFLRVLEQSGDIKWVGNWGIEEIIRMHNEFANRFPTVRLRFSLNLYTKQLLDPKLSTSFIETIKKASAKPEDYMLEISDFMMLEKIAVIKTNIYKLRDFGFKIAVDGFELDGQSVQAIQRTPIDVIKLGRGFLKDIENNFMKERLLEILVKFATENNKMIISEGIETAEVSKYVKEQNVFYEQGYFFGKPMSEENFVEYLDRHEYQTLLSDVSALEDTENIMNMVDSEKRRKIVTAYVEPDLAKAKAFVEQSEEDMSPEDLLNKRVNETLAKKNNPQAQENTDSAEELYDAIEQDGQE